MIIMLIITIVTIIIVINSIIIITRFLTLFLTPTSAPYSSTVRTISTYPYLLARMRAVSPSCIQMKHLDDDYDDDEYKIPYKYMQTLENQFQHNMNFIIIIIIIIVTYIIIVIIIIFIIILIPYIILYFNICSALK